MLLSVSVGLWPHPIAMEFVWRNKKNPGVKVCHTHPHTNTRVLESRFEGMLRKLGMQRERERELELALENFILQGL